MSRPLPRQPVPALDLPLAGGGRFALAENPPEGFTLLLFYRGLHCPICKGQLGDLQNRLDALEEAGVRAVAISMDGRERAEQAKSGWGLARLDMAYDLSEQTAREWGLYISSAISDKEPERFSEPGLFLVNPDGTLYFVAVQSMPFTRPPLDELLMGINYARSHGYPPRGTLA
jgi:peroxiredoxin